MTSRVRPESREELEARTKKMRDKGKVATTVIYKLSATVDHGGIGGTIAGPRNGELRIKIERGIAAATTTAIELDESQLESLIEFLRFAKEECQTLKETYEQIDDTTADADHRTK